MFGLSEQYIDVCILMVSAVLQHVSRPRQPLEVAGRLFNRQFLYLFHQCRCTSVFNVGVADH